MNFNNSTVDNRNENTYYSKLQTTKHPFHMVRPSPWPLLTSAAAFFTVLGATLFIISLFNLGMVAECKPSDTDTLEIFNKIKETSGVAASSFHNAELQLKASWYQAQLVYRNTTFTTPIIIYNSFWFYTAVIVTAVKKLDFFGGLNAGGFFSLLFTCIHHYKKMVPPEFVVSHPQLLVTVTHYYVGTSSAVWNTIIHSPGMDIGDKNIILYAYGSEPGYAFVDVFKVIRIPDTNVLLTTFKLPENFPKIGDWNIMTPSKALQSGFISEDTINVFMSKLKE